MLLRGPPGSGKSDLLLRLIAEAGAGLVADDQVLLTRAGAGPIAQPPAALQGVLEARGVGLLRLPPAGPAPVVLLADLSAQPQRLPAPAHETLLGCQLRRVEIDSRCASAVAKLQLALGRRGAAILPPDWHTAAPVAPGGASGDGR